MGEGEEFRTLKITPFTVGERYYDAVGRKWKVIERDYIGHETWALIVRRWGKYHIALAESNDTTATVLFEYGFTTIYADDE